MMEDRERLLDIQEAIERIEKYAARGQEAFEQDELIQTWIVHHLQIILVHDYFGIDADVVWSVVENDLEPLKMNIVMILQDLGE